MNKKTERLLDLLEDSTLDDPLKEDKIVQVLQYEEDLTEAKTLARKILRGNFKSVKEKSINDLISAFTVEISLENNLQNQKSDGQPPEIIDENSVYNEEYIETLKSQLELLEYKSSKEIKKLKEENDKLLKLLKLTKISK